MKMALDDDVPLSTADNEKRQLWDDLQLDLAQRVRVPQTDGVVEQSHTFYKDFFALPQNLFEFLPVNTPISAQVERDIAYQRQSISPSCPPLRFVGGLDISFVKGTNLAVACLVVLEYPSMQKRGTYMHHCEIKEPYIPGYLAFREVGPLLELFEKVSDELRALECMPQLLLIDGCGVHHPRRCGLASHLGVLLGIPTIGCAKKFMALDGITRKIVDSLFLDADENIIRPVIGESATLWSYAVRPNKRSRRLLFISPGHCVGYAVSVALTLSMCLYRIPEPIRAADLSSRDYIRQIDVLVREDTCLNIPK